MGDFADIFGEPERIERPKPVPGACEYCGATEGVQLEDSRTAYDTSRLDTATRLERIADRDDPPEDPNRPVWLCRPCAEDHHSYWDEMWAMYYSDRM